MILEEVLKDSCQLNTINTDMYRFTEDGLCLIATSEQTLAGYYRGETL
jgi:seryl-tRNA synthetase